MAHAGENSRGARCGWSEKLWARESRLGASGSHEGQAKTASKTERAARRERAGNIEIGRQAGPECRGKREGSTHPGILTPLRASPMNPARWRSSSPTRPLLDDGGTAACRLRAAWTRREERKRLCSATAQGPGDEPVSARRG
ncbi:hypothetical protein GGTG_00357 [Gaeumannomyces tritici R3-111a-1]|uniref:Uncharacterized protein n=1 Tax=Gaeumannomyces tritici (strain R3-111a-1) TaxID=644352 RepID=J3NGG7_GAET3|nr:hypothetical protein GGTG_00357 [Gaeumannomyces tritici R3-111a-1]EJT80357.1 hypothetical protein GGTG_00357 [Gaeumannomyces tritici R3-111a-1]